MSKRAMNGASIVATMTWCGQEYEIIRFGCRLRIVCPIKNRSLGTKGYVNVKDITSDYPEAVVRDA